MSTDTARVTEVHEVTVENPAPPKREGRFMNWLRRLGERLRDGWNRATAAVGRWGRKFWSDTKTTGRTAVDWARRATAAGGRGLRWLARNTLATATGVGRGFAKAARFFGRTALTSGRVTLQFLGITGAWFLRSVSWLFRTVLETVFDVAFVTFMVMMLIMMLLAFTHDKYEEKVHSHTVAMSKGRPSNAVSARQSAGWAANEAANRMGSWEGQPGDITFREERVTEIQKDDESIHAEAEAEETSDRLWTWRDIEDPIGSYLARDFDTYVPYGARDITVGTALDKMIAYGTIKAASAPYLFDDERAQSLTDNETFNLQSYWSGRQEAWNSLHDAIAELSGVSAEEYQRSFMTRARAVWATVAKSRKHAFDNRKLHRNSYKAGWDKQVEWILARDLNRYGKAAEHAAAHPTTVTETTTVTTETPASV